MHGTLVVDLTASVGLTAISLCLEAKKDVKTFANTCRAVYLLLQQYNECAAMVKRCIQNIRLILAIDSVKSHLRLSIIHMSWSLVVGVIDSRLRDVQYTNTSV